MSLPIHHRLPCTGLARGLLPVLLSLTLLGLPGCGFHLRGSLDIPPELSPFYVQSGGLLGDAVKARLQGTDVRIASTAKEAGMILRILSEQHDSRLVAVDANGKALAYMLSYRIRFDATDGDGRIILPVQSIVLDRTFDDNPSVSVLGKELESGIIYQDLASDAADQILLRLRAALANA